MRPDFENVVYQAIVAYCVALEREGFFLGEGIKLAEKLSDMTADEMVRARMEEDAHVKRVLKSMERVRRLAYAAIACTGIGIAFSIANLLQLWRVFW